MSERLVYQLGKPIWVAYVKKRGDATWHSLACKKCCATHQKCIPWGKGKLKYYLVVCDTCNCSGRLDWEYKLRS